MNNSNILSQAKRCYNCKNAPCMSVCPLSNNIPLIMQYVASGDMASASNELTKTSRFGAICSLVCPYEQLCMGSCIRSKVDGAVNICEVEHAVATFSDSNVSAYSFTASNHCVAVVGSGVSGVSCAIELASRGISVTMYSLDGVIGGVARSLLPEFRLPSSNWVGIDNLVNSLPISMVTCRVGQDITLAELSSQFDAVYLATGLARDNHMGIDGEDDARVLSASCYLSSPVAMSDVVVVGGGNVAIDCARTVVRLGGRATVVYRRTESDMPAYSSEVLSAVAEGVQFKYLLAPSSIVGDDELTFNCTVMSVSGSDNVRNNVVKTEQTQAINCSNVIVAIGYSMDANVLRSTNIDVGSRVRVDSRNYTGYNNVFSGGDITNGSSTVVEAVADGLRSARSIIQQLG